MSPNLDLLGHSITGERRKIAVPRGCGYCPLASNRRIHKVKGLIRVIGRKAMLWAQGPGQQENTKRIELVGPAGQLLWGALKSVGLVRLQFDIQNVVRCWPIDQHGVVHTPTKEEIRCCSIFSDEALERNDGEAIVHLILGEVAGKALLRQGYRKDKTIFWYEPWGAYVVLAPHPSFLLRLGGQKAAGWRYDDFVCRLKGVAACVHHPGRWGYIKAQDYGLVSEDREMAQLEDQLYYEAAAGRRISVDIETGSINGRTVVLLVGFGWGYYHRKKDWRSWRGGARSVVLYHPEASQADSRVKPLLERVRNLLKDPKLRKALQHGSFDTDAARNLLGMRLRGYDFDTQYGAYMQNSALRTYSLEAQVNRNFPEFADYKQTVEAWDGNFAAAPLSALMLRNCGDCDATKRIEETTACEVDLGLMQVYIHAAFTLDKMEGRGPLLDWRAHEKIRRHLKTPLENLRRRLQHLAGDPDFNPDAPGQVARLLYDHLGLEQLEGRSTDADVLRILAAKSKSIAPRLVMAHRKLQKAEDTYLVGYAASAQKHHGELRTIWWLTGAATGRLRSGKSTAAEAEGVVNFQNIHGNPILRNMLVSDTNWRKALAK